jgi:glycerol uptake facilitator-like aquaporin
MAQVAAPEVPAAVAGLAEKISVKVGGDMSVVLIVLAVVGAFFAAYLLYFVLKKQISASYTYTFPETMMPISGLAKTL